MSDSLQKLRILSRTEIAVLKIRSGKLTDVSSFPLRNVCAPDDELLSAQAVTTDELSWGIGISTGTGAQAQVTLHKRNREAAPIGNFVQVLLRAF